ncbi:MAG: cell division protein ZapA [Treponema sp.]|nr:cell division protein ZapA [Treponema sp.]
MGELVIDAFNPPFVIKANESDEYLNKLLGYYKKITQQIKNSNSLQNDLQVSALAGVMLCDELYKEKSKISQISKGKIPTSSIIVDKEKSEEAEKLAKKMIEKLDKALDENNGKS